MSSGTIFNKQAMAPRAALAGGAAFLALAACAANTAAPPAADQPSSVIHLPTKGTWITEDGHWTIELKKEGRRVTAGLHHDSAPAEIGDLQCKGKIDDLGKVSAWCKTDGWSERKLHGTFPDLKLWTTGKGGGASFAFTPDEGEAEGEDGDLKLPGP